MGSSAMDTVQGGAVSGLVMVVNPAFTRGEVLQVGGGGGFVVTRQVQAELIREGSSWHWVTYVGRDVVAVLTCVVYVSQKDDASTDLTGFSSARRQLSWLH